MIILREYKEEDLKEVKPILKEEKIEDFSFEGIIYVVLDNENLIGIGQTEIEDEKYFLRYLIIEKDERKMGFGDGLLRAILFKLENKNIDKLYYRGKDEYLLKKGFKKAEEDILFIDIKDFFNRVCNCREDSHGL